jgi:hypothetical protein
MKKKKEWTKIKAARRWKKNAKKPKEAQYELHVNDKKKIQLLLSLLDARVDSKQLQWLSIAEKSFPGAACN